ncbi:MAG: hypothetical protein AB7P03_21675 [Kofleriaceae bacterium]
MKSWRAAGTPRPSRWRWVRYAALLTGLSAIATCPSAKRACTTNTRAREAEDLLGYLADRVSLAVAATGKLPELPAGPTPSPSCCDQGGACSPDPSVWSEPGWRALEFSIDDEYRYTYQYVPDLKTQTATIRAIGDLDCDGVTSLYELKLSRDPANPQALVRAWTRKLPLE